MAHIVTIGTAAVVLLLAAVMLAANTLSPAAAQDAQGSQIELRVIAQPLENGRIEFGIEHRGEQILPTARYLTQRLIQQRRGQWLSSTPVEVVGDSLAPPALSAGPDADEALYRDVGDLWETRGFGRAVEVVRVAAQPLADGRIEFAIEHNGERIQPDARYLTPQLIRDRQGNWLRSSPVAITAAVTPAELVRAESASAATARSPYGTPADVAAECQLSALEFLTVGPWWADSIIIGSYVQGEWDSHPHLTEFVTSTISYRHHEWDDEWVILRANERARESLRTKMLATSYGFMVQDVRWQAPTVWWVAEFTCGSTNDESSEESQNLQ